MKSNHNENNLLSLENMIKLSWCTMINKSTLGFHSQYFQNIVFTNLNHDINTRNKEYNLDAPFYTLKTSKNSIFCNGINYWNQNSIGKFKTEPLKFKSKMKNYLLNQQME